MQRRADDPREVAALARRQERELRAWLNGGRAVRRALDRREAALEAAAAEVEDAHGVPVDVVAVGDAPLDDARRGARRGGARGARQRREVRAAARRSSRVRRGGATTRVEVFVRDRGPGFDPERGAGRPARRARVDRRPHGAPRRPRRDPHRARRGHRGRAGDGAGMSDRRPSSSSTTTSCSAPACAPSSTASSRSSATPPTVEDAVRCIVELEPDVVLLDVQMPGGGGVEVIRERRARGGRRSASSRCRSPTPPRT